MLSEVYSRRRPQKGGSDGAIVLCQKFELLAVITRCNVYNVIAALVYGGLRFDQGGGRHL
jgi:hypothetical protein